MSAARPVLLVRARVQPRRLAEFRAWYRRVHLPHVLAIPGIVGYRGLEPPHDAPPGAPNVISVFLFENEGVIQTALQSVEAQQARHDWEQWAEAVRDLSIQIYTSMDVRAMLHHLN